MFIGLCSLISNNIRTLWNYRISKNASDFWNSTTFSISKRDEELTRSLPALTICIEAYKESNYNYTKYKKIMFMLKTRMSKQEWLASPPTSGKKSNFLEENFHEIYWTNTVVIWFLENAGNVQEMSPILCILHIEHLFNASYRLAPNILA